LPSLKLLSNHFFQIISSCWQPNFSTVLAAVPGRARHFGRAARAELGWTSASISAAGAINITLFRPDPIFCRVVDGSLGLRWLVLCALVLAAGSVALTA
jgi:hypothetical protein